MHSSLVIGRELLRLAEQQGLTLTPMQLLKLVYICHGFVLAILHRPLISDSAEAWRWGPVIPELYHAIKDYRSQPVLAIEIKAENLSELDATEKAIIAAVFNKYGKMTAMSLSRLTHAADTPWSRAYDGSFGVEISDDLIEDHYRMIMAA